MANYLTRLANKAVDYANPTTRSGGSGRVKTGAENPRIQREFEQFEAARERAAQALADQITLAQQGVTLAQEASDKSLAEMRAQAARGLASQFQAAGRRAAGGGTLAALGQIGRDTERAISAQQAQDDARIQAAKMAAADVEATKTLERAELMDRQRNAQEQFAAILAGMPDEDLIGKNMDRIRYLRAQRAQTADPALIEMINQRIKVEEGGY